MGTFPSPSWSHAPQKITTTAVRAQDQVLSTVDAVKSPDSPTPSGWPVTGAAAVAHAAARADDGDGCACQVGEHPRAASDDAKPGNERRHQLRRPYFRELAIARSCRSFSS